MRVAGRLVSHAAVAVPQSHGGGGDQKLDRLHRPHEDSGRKAARDGEGAGQTAPVLRKGGWWHGPDPGRSSKRRARPADAVPGGGHRRDTAARRRAKARASDTEPRGSRASGRTNRRLVIVLHGGRRTLMRRRRGWKGKVPHGAIERYRRDDNTNGSTVGAAERWASWGRQRLMAGVPRGRQLTCPPLAVVGCGCCFEATGRWPVYAPTGHRSR